MYKKCLYTNISHISTNICIQNVYTKCLYICKIYITFQQTFVTKFSWHSFFDFVYKMYTKVCRNVVYILYTLIAYIFYNFCIQNEYTVSV